MTIHTVYSESHHHRTAYQKHVVCVNKIPICSCVLREDASVWKHLFRQNLRDHYSIKRVSTSERESHRQTSSESNVRNRQRKRKTDSNMLVIKRWLISIYILASVHTVKQVFSTHVSVTCSWLALIPFQWFLLVLAFICHGSKPKPNEVTVVERDGKILQFCFWSLSSSEMCFPSDGDQDNSAHITGCSVAM